MPLASPISNLHFQPDEVGSGRSDTHFQPILEPTYLAMKPQFTLSLLAIAFATGLSSHAAVITSSFGSTTGVDNDNQAGPLRGVTYKIITTGTYTNPTATAGSSVGANSYTATHALSATDNTATTVLLTNLTWQTSSTAAASNGFSASPLFVSVFSGLTVNSGGTVTSLGTWVGSSSNSIASSIGTNTQISYNFADLALVNGSSYQFVFTTTATPTLTSEIGSASLELKVGANLLQETELVAGNASSYNNRAGWEPVFSMTFNSVPEPAVSLLASLALLRILRRQR
jgi:hypothetical protein